MNDNDIYERNIRFIIQRFSNLANHINETKTDRFTVCTEHIEDNNVLYVIDKENNTIQLSSLYDTDEIAKIWAEDVLKNLKYDSNIFVMGFGDGRFIRSIINRMSDTNTIYVYEPDISIIGKVIYEFDISDIIGDKRFNLEVGTASKDSIYSLYKDKIYVEDLYKAVTTVHPNYTKLYPEECINYFSEFKNLALSESANQGYFETYGKYINTCVLKNINELISSKSLKNLVEKTPDNMTAIVVSAGPSLSGNIAELKKAKGHSIIISVDSAIKALILEGIVPDICVTVDSMKDGAYFDDDLSKDVPLICTPEAASSNINKNKSQKFFIASSNPVINILCKEKNAELLDLPTGGSVANSAASFALKLGVKTLILVGQDLAFTNNKTHADNTVRGEMNLTPEDETRALTTVTGINGEVLKSSNQFLIYKKWFEEQINNYPDVRFINATEHGAKISGYEHITLREAIDKECKKNIDYANIIGDCCDLFTDDNKDKMVQEIHRIPNELTKIYNLAQNGMSVYDKMLNLIYKDKYKSNQFVKMYNEVKRITDEIHDNIISYFVFNEIQEYVSNDLKNIYGDEQGEREDLIMLCKTGKNTFEHICMGAEKVKEKYEELVDV